MKKHLFFILFFTAFFSTTSILHPSEIELTEKKISPLFKKETHIKLANFYTSPNNQKAFAYFFNKRPTFLQDTVAKELYLLAKFCKSYQKYKSQNHNWSAFRKKLKKISFKNRLTLLDLAHVTTLPKTYARLLLYTICREIKKKPKLFETYKNLIQKNSFIVIQNMWEKEPKSPLTNTAKAIETFSDETKLSFLWEAQTNTWRTITAGSYTVTCQKIKKNTTHSTHRLIQVFDQNAKKLFSFTVKNKNQLFINKQWFAGISSYHQFTTDPSINMCLEQHKVLAYIIDLKTGLINKIEEPVCYYDSPMVCVYRDQLLFFWPQKIFCFDMTTGLKTVLSTKKDITRFSAFAQKKKANTLVFYSYTPPSVAKALSAWILSSLTLIPFNFDKLKTYSVHNFKITKKELSLSDYLNKIIEKKDTQRLILT